MIKVQRDNKEHAREKDMTPIGFMLFINGVPVHFSAEPIDTSQYGNPQNMDVQAIYIERPNEVKAANALLARLNK